MSFDTIVVGSGLAGLTFAALAAHGGARVLVLEAHTLPGGYGHTFTFSFGKAPDLYRFNAQLHYVWNCGPGQTVHSVLRKLGLADEVTFQQFDRDGFDRMRIPVVGRVNEHGELRLRHRVVEFLFEGDAVVGVVAEEVDDDAVSTGVRHEFRAPRVVCNMDPQQAARLAGRHRFSRKVRRQLDYSYSPSCFMAYLVVEGIDLRDHGFGRSNLFHSELADLNEAFRRMEQGDYSVPSFAMTVPSLLTEDRSDCPPGKQVVELLTVADHDRFMHLRIANPRAYRDKKTEIYDSICEVIERDYVPGFRDRVCFKLLASPTTNQRYCLSPEGNSYGSDMIPGQIGAGRLGPESSVPGLWFCNASSGYAGFAGTFWTGATLYERLTGDTVLTGPHVG